MSTHNHSVSDWSGDWSTSDHSNRSWTNVARPWFLLKIDPPSEKFGITSLSAIVEWVSCRTKMKALFLSASCSMTEILFSVSPSVFSWSMLGRGSSSAAFLLPSREKGVMCPIPRWTQPARVAVVAVVMTDLVSISRNSATGRATWRHICSSLNKNDWKDSSHVFFTCTLDHHRQLVSVVCTIAPMTIFVRVAATTTSADTKQTSQHK